MAAIAPPIYRDCRRLLVQTELMVMRFAKYHKYTVGTDLRRAAMAIMRTVSQAVHDKAQQAQHVQALILQVDDYKLCLQLAMDLGAFKHSVRGSVPRVSPSFHAFEQAADLAAAVGKQCGGWWQALARRQRAHQAAPAETAAEHGAAGTAASSARGAGSTPPPSAAARPASLSGQAPSDAPAPEGKP